MLQQAQTVIEGIIHGLCRGLGLYRIARFLRNRFGQPSSLSKQIELLRDLYGAFIRPEDLVFDIGASRGDRTDVFLSLKARVTAVEPNGYLAERLRREFRFSRVVIEPLALGARAGILPLHHCGNPELSSLSGRWIDKMRNTQFPEMNWERIEMVPVTTLDNLVRQHGEPAFVKLSVEGFENEVLRGLNRPVQALSFEVTAGDLEMADECFSHLMRLDAYEFNVSRDDAFRLEMSRWSGAAETLYFLASREGSWRTADIYARIVQHDDGEGVLLCPPVITTISIPS